jgi:hypothetical protein
MTVDIEQLNGRGGCAISLDFSVRAPRRTCRTRASPPSRPTPRHSKGLHRRKPLLRGEHTHARVLRARGEAFAADVLNLDVNMSSRQRREHHGYDLHAQAMQVDIFVVRDASTGAPRIAASPHCVERGERTSRIPRRDLLTIKAQGRVQLCVAIVGDVKHRASRVPRIRP